MGDRCISSQRDCNFRPCLDTKKHKKAGKLHLHLLHVVCAILKHTFQLQRRIQQDSLRPPPGFALTLACHFFGSSLQKTVAGGLDNKCANLSFVGRRKKAIKCISLVVLWRIQFRDNKASRGEKELLLRMIVKHNY